MGRDLHETFLLIQLFQQLYTISEKKNGPRKLPPCPTLYKHRVSDLKDPIFRPSC